MAVKTLFKRTALVLLAVIAVSGALIAVEYFGGQMMGLFSGSRPDGLGFRNGKFKPTSWKPNTVSSTIDKADATHYIAPLAFSGDAAAAWAKFAALVKSQSRVRVVMEQPEYMHAEFKSAGLGFVDDVEFALDAKAGVIHVRSASRLGVRDFDVNRKRIEHLRAQMKP